MSRPRREIGGGEGSSVLMLTAGTCLIVAMAVVWYSTEAIGGNQPPAPPLFVVVTTIATAVVVVCAVRLDRRGHRRSSMWILSLGFSLALYLLLAGASASTVVGAAPWGPWVAALDATWYMAPQTLCGLCAIVAVEDISAEPGRFLPWRIGIITLTLLVALLGSGVVDPVLEEPSIGPPLASTLLGSPTAGLAFEITIAVWMLSSLVAPALAHSLIRRSRGLLRGRLTIVAIAALAPTLTLATYVLLAAGSEMGLLDASLARAVLSVVLCLPPIVVAVGVVVGQTSRDDGITGSIANSVRWVLGGLWLLLSAQMAVLLAAVIAVQSRGQGAVVVASAAIVLFVVLLAAYVPAERRIIRAAKGDEDSTAYQSHPSALEGVLTPREREVLALIADGKSNAAIAQSLFLSERTIDGYVTSIFDKLGLGRRADANRRVQAAAAWIHAQTASGKSMRPG